LYCAGGQPSGDAFARDTVAPQKMNPQEVQAIDAVATAWLLEAA
jgi:hypothetical protein